MFRKYLHILTIIAKKNKLRFFTLQFLLLVNAFFEIFSIASVTPLLGMMLTPEIVLQSKFYPYMVLIKNFFGFQDDLLFVCAASLVSVLLGTLVSFSTKVLVQKFSFKAGEELSSDLLSYYLHLDYYYHAVQNSSFFIKNVLQESNRLITHILNPLMQANVNILVLFVIFSLIVIVNPLYSFFVLMMLAVGFVIFYSLAKKTLQKNSKGISKYGNEQYVYINQSFAGIKEIKLYGNELMFVDLYSQSTMKRNKFLLVSFVVNILPGQLIQMSVFIIITILAILIHLSKESFDINIPELMFFAIAGYKILPPLNSLYSNFSTAQGNITAYDEIIIDLEKALDKQNLYDSGPCINSISSLSLNDIRFKYHDKNVLNGISIRLEAGKIYGFAGPSGGGKTTLVDIVVGLLKCDSGNLIINNQNAARLDELRALTSYVSQSSYIFDGTFYDNISFGQENADRNESKAQQAMIASGLSDFSLEDEVGEQGKKLSGGQKQRLGIARALYRNKPLLVLDESTSALDGVTEHKIVDEMFKLKDEKIVAIIAHRLSTLKRCDKIFVIDKGQIVQEGSYDELVEEKKGLFWEMASKGGFEPG